MTTFNKFLPKANSLKVMEKMRKLEKQSEWQVMVNYKLSNMLKLMLKINLLKVLVKTRVLVKPFISMAMESKKNTAMLNKLRNSPKVLVKTRVLVKPFISMAMVNKKNIAMLKQKTNRFTKMMIFS